MDGQAVDIIQQMCVINDIQEGEEWVRIPPDNMMGSREKL
jgi:hypothetical protein